jgi:ferric-dicitrate binding protein FerR (iron transport regulator)
LVEVLGTHFNVKAYDNEAAMRVTLLEGSVKVNNGQSVILKPKEQAIAGAHSSLTIDHSPNIDQVMAWKNGLFNFDGVTLQEVMKQLERWYDIEVVYEGKPPVTRFAGEMEMNMPLNDLLVMFNEMNIHFKIEAGRKLVVKP